MDANDLTPPTPPAAPPPPAPAPAAPPAPAPVAAAPASSGMKDIFRKMNWTEIGFGIVGAAALYYVILYYKYNLYASSSFKIQMQNEVDNIKMQVADISSAVASKEEISTSPQVFI